MAQHRLWALGSNSDGQLGIGICEEKIWTPRQCLFADPEAADVVLTPKEYRDIKVAAGGNHTILLYPDGRAYAAGRNDYGQCGLTPSAERITKFTRIRFVDYRTASTTEERIIDNFQAVAATWEATMFLTRNGTTGCDELWSSGSGDRGELGQGQGEIMSFEPRLVKMPQWRINKLVEPQIIKLEARFRHTVALLDDGRLLGCGASKFGQLGMTYGPPGERILWEMSPILSLPLCPDFKKSMPSASSSEAGRLQWLKDFNIVCGNKTTLILAPPHGLHQDEATFYFLGPASDLAPDPDVNNIKALFSPGDKFDWNKVSASNSNVYIVNRYGMSQSCGPNQLGQNIPMAMTRRFDGVLNIVAGNEHAAANFLTNIPPRERFARVSRANVLAESVREDMNARILEEGHGRVAVWGWGAHGECGAITASSGLGGGGLYNILEVEGESILQVIGAGASTTFLVSWGMRSAGISAKEKRTTSAAWESSPEKRQQT